MEQSKVFVVSLHRNGTRSIYKYLIDLGFTSIHHPGQVSKEYLDAAAPICTDLDAVYRLVRPLAEQVDAVSDTPFNVLYRQLYNDFPNARFLAFCRPANAWIKSVREHCRDRDFGPFERTQYSELTNRNPTDIEDISDLELREVYYSYHAKLISFFRENAPNQLMIGELEEPDLSEKISTFLGLNHSTLSNLPHIADGSKRATPFDNVSEVTVQDSRKQRNFEVLKRSLKSLVGYKR